jgi:ectoine hydroxylase
MKLTPEQLAAVRPRRLPVLPRPVHARRDAHVLTDAVPELYARREAYNVREKGSDAVRTNFAPTCTASPSRGWRATRA